jgi:NAD(P)H-hydrate repair Nnr-like enzyme with NAD(P)H-hydrate epimerase domain
MLPRGEYSGPRTTYVNEAPKKKEFDVILDESMYGIGGRQPPEDPMAKFQLQWLEQQKKKKEDKDYYDAEYEKIFGGKK